MTEYPIDEEFWNWWKNYFGEEPSLDLRQKLCYNNIEEKEEENSNGISEVPE